MALDGTTQVVATKHLTKGTTGNRQLHITIHVSVVCTTINHGNTCFWFTAHDYD